MHAPKSSVIPPPPSPFLFHTLPPGSEAPGPLPTNITLEMMLLSNRDVSQTYVDDQSPTLSNSYVGHWTRYHDGNYTKWYLGTYTATSTPGDSFSFTFSGTPVIYDRFCFRGTDAMTEIGIQAALYGGLSNSNVSEDGSFISYPTADYLLDGSPGESFCKLPLVNNLFGAAIQLAPNGLSSTPATTSFTS